MKKEVLEKTDRLESLLNGMDQSEDRILPIYVKLTNENPPFPFNFFASKLDFSAAIFCFSPILLPANASFAGI